MMAKVNLSVPDDLKTEMQRLHWVNWSRVFADVARETIIKSDALESDASERRLFQGRGRAA